MKKKTLIIIGVVVAVVVLVGGFLAFRNNSTSSSSEFQTEELKRGSLKAEVGATGTVRANQSALLGWQTAGAVDVVNSKVGDLVEADAVLASLDPTSLTQSIILAKADLVTAQRALDELKVSEVAKAQAQLNVIEAKKIYEKARDNRESMDNKRADQKTLDEAQDDLDKASDLVKQAEMMADKVTELPKGDPTRTQAENFLTQAKAQRDYALKVVNWYNGQPTDDEIAESDAKLAVAQANYDAALKEWDRLKDGPDPNDVLAATARVDALQATINMSQISSPFAGTVTIAEPKPGDQVAPGVTAFRVDDLSHLLMDVEISEVDINSIEPGQSVTLTFDAIPDKEYHGVVNEVGQVGNLTQGAVNFTVTVELNDADEMVKPGMTAAAIITINSLNDVLLIPNRAVRFVDGNRVVYVLQDGKLTPVVIEIGASSDAYSQLISGDIEEGALIVLNPPATFGGGPGGGMFGGN